MSPALRTGLFALLAVVQLFAAGNAIVVHERTRAEGTAHRFELAPVDPVDPFRGRYVRLRFAAERTELEPPRTLVVYAVLEVGEDGFTHVGALTSDPPREGDYVRTRVVTTYDGKIVYLPFDHFYAEASTARRIEDAFRRAGPDARAHAVVRVRQGHGVIESIVVNGEEVARTSE